jgi:hypothetical protein
MVWVVRLLLARLAEREDQTESGRMLVAGVAATVSRAVA